MNYLIVGVVILLVIVLLVFLIVKNQKDKKSVLEQMNIMDLKAEKHKETELED
jgi:Ca2+/Na+ antiporter